MKSQKKTVTRDSSKTHKNIDTDKKKKLKKNTEFILSGLETIDQSREYSWGLGIEHEMQLFHVPKSGFVDANILFDSQESTCYLTGDKSDEGACCKSRDKCFKSYDDKNRPKITKDEHEWLSNIDWELSGRQAEGCKDGRVILPRTPLLMPELITGNFKNRSIESIHQEIVFLEDKYIELQMKNPHTQ